MADGSFAKAGYSTQYDMDGGQQSVISQQPTAKMGFSFETVPRGLEYLSSLDQIDIHQILHIVEGFGWEKNNQYEVFNKQHQQFLHIKEDTDCCTRQWLKHIRPFDIMINDMQGQTVIQLQRDFHCQGFMCPCSQQQMDIMCPPINKVATVREVYTCCIPRYEICDASDQLLFKIEGIRCWFGCCMEIPFKIMDPNGQDRGEITKHWGGWDEVFGAVTNFTITYAPNETPLNKAILLGATILVDFMYFERKRK